MPSDAGAVGVPVTSDGEVPAQLGLSREALAGAGFTAEVGQTWLLPRSDGPFLVAVGIGDRAALDATRLRDAAAAFARAAHRQAHLAGPLADVPNVAPDVAAQAAVEGVLLARYRYNALKGKPQGTPLAEVTIVAPPERHEALARGAERGKITAAAVNLARDLNNTPRRDPHRHPDGGGGPGDRPPARAGGGGLRQGRHRGAGAGGPAGRQRRERRAPADDQAELPPAGRPRPATWPWWARG